MSRRMGTGLSGGERASRAAIAAVLAMLFAGSAARVLGTALGLTAPALPLYAAAALAAALCVLGQFSRGGAVLAAIGFAATAGLYAAANAGGLGAIRALFASLDGQGADAALAARGGRTLLTGGAFVAAALYFALLNRRELVSMAVALELSILVCCHTASETASLVAAVPGLLALAGAFALTAGVQRDIAALRVFVPAALALALALVLLPGGRVTWPPLEEAANRVRGVVEQYLHFTRERIAFSIGEQGYDHAGRVGDSVVAMLGGPAQPHTDPVMSVRTDAPALLRGTIRSTYTGYSWVDTTPKNRYLYFDLTHRAIRDRVFGPADALRGALQTDEISVEMLGEGTSTLFVPGYLERFSMDLSTAVYYNTEGEMFLTRDVKPGDAYSLRGLLPQSGEALRRAAAAGEGAKDDDYRRVLSAFTALPEGIDGRVYTLTAQVIGRADSAWDRAEAIRAWLSANIRYTLQPGVPPTGRDFVSHMLLDAREGYCSYYATAMAVMGRIAGLPTRYVEGFLARPDREVLTGEDAHAWAEVYFEGLGWIPFDATGGTTAAGGPLSDGDGQPPQGGAEGEGDADPGIGPAPTPEPAGGAADDPTPSPSPEPAPDGAGGETPPEPGAQDAPPEGSPEPPARRGGVWAWIALLLLLLAGLIALAARWARGRLRATDPARLCRAATRPCQAALMLYRANLTALAHLGQAPAGGEAPETFAERMAARLDNPDYAAFVRAVCAAAYGRRPLRQQDVDAGLRAYRRFTAALGRRERLRFALTRVFRGLGDFDAIP